MSGERTEEPTPRRLAEARRRGDVVRSRAFAAALGTVAATIALRLVLAGTLARLVMYQRSALTTALTVRDLSPAAVTSTLAAALRVLAAAVGPVWLATAAVAVLWGAWRTRGLLTLAPLEPKWERVTPKLERLFGAATVVEVMRGLVVVLLLGAIAFASAGALVRPLAGATGLGGWGVLTLVGAGVRRLLDPILGATLLIGFADDLWQRRKHQRSLRMTREEVRREHKDSEGDPNAKAERARARREILEQRALADVRDADFVVVNPDHLAIAVKYDRDGGGAPVVVARGERLVAEQIKAIARDAGIPIYRDVPLARALHEVPEGDEVPETLWEAVAEILRAVYGMTAPSPASPAASEPAATREPARQTWRRV